MLQISTRISAILHQVADVVSRAKAPRRFLILPVLALLLLTSAISFGQVERASITGTVTDASGGIIPGATVKVTDEMTNTTVSLLTDSAGEYTARNLNPGSYSIAVEKGGFNKHVDKNFVVEVSQAARLDVALAVGSVSQTVEVTSAAPMMQTENASVGQVVDSHSINDLPLNGRNIAELAVIAPGVTGLTAAPAATFSSGARSDELRPGGTTIIANGALDTYNKMLLDGVDNTEMVAQTFVVRPSLGGIQEFNLITANAGPEYDRGAGTIIVTSTRSGGNQLHGSVYEFLRNSYVDAKNYFDRSAGPTPPYKLNDLGAGIGGPILRNKVFFFADYEGYFERLASTVVSTVPTLAMKQGIFEGVNHIFDPTTTVASGSGYMRTEFVNDTILPGQMDPIAAQIVALYPSPQTSALTNNYVSNPVKATAENRADARVDYSLPKNQSVFARYSIDNSQLTMPNTYNSVVGGNEGQFSGSNSTIGQNAVLGYNVAITPQLAAEYRFGLSKYTSFFLASKLSAPIWSQIPGANQGIPFEPSAPIISPSGYGGLGDSRSEPQVRLEHTDENLGDITWTRGKHDMKFGVDILHHLVSEAEVVPSQSPFGRFNFDNTLTDNPAATSGTGNAIATMLLGYPSNTTRFFFLAKTPHVLGNEFNFYIQDNWRIMSKLTLNLGVHYEIDAPYTERNNEWANFNPVTAQLMIAGQNGVGRTAGVNTDYGAIGPRVGFAYQLSNKMVLRGGFGIYFDPQASDGTTSRQEIQWPFAFAYSLVPGSIIPGNKVSSGFLTVADLPPGQFTTPFGVLKSIAPNYKPTSTQEMNLGLQRQLTSHSTLTLSYAGSLGRHRAWANPIDQPAPGPGNIQARRPFDAQFPNVTGITEEESVANSAYSSFQANFQQRLNHGFTFGGNYVWSHSLDNSGGDGGSNGPVPQDPTNRRADWGSSDNDVMDRVNLFGTYALPFGPGKTFASNPSVLNKYVIGGWQLNGIALLQSGYPFTVTTSAQPTNTGVAGRADVVPGVDPIPAHQSVNAWFNTAAFAVPAAYQWGDSKRDSLRGPDNVNFDLTSEKTIPIAAEKDLEFRAEFFNIFNHPEFAVPASTIGSAGVATITSTTHPSRQIQFVLKLTF
jgi:hypothetical protein